PQNSSSLALAEQQRQAQRQQLEQQRQEQQRDQRQAQQELIARIQEQQRQQQEANQRAQEEARRRAEEQLLQNLDNTDKDRAALLRDRMLRNETSPDLNPNTPATPESHRQHLSGVAAPSRSAVPNSSGTQAGSNGTNESDLAESSTLAGAPHAGENPGDVHTDYASEEQRNSAVEGAADDYLASEPEPEPGVDLEQLWLSFLANNDGPYTEELPTESIYGETVGIYNGLLRGWPQRQWHPPDEYFFHRLSSNRINPLRRQPRNPADPRWLGGRHRI